MRDDLRAVIELTHERGGKVKVVFENCCTSGATLDDLRLMRRYAPAHVQVKPAGGVRDLDMALAVRDVGVTRFGCTRTVEILEECQRRLAAGTPSVR